jgi:hypothetical protein
MRRSIIVALSAALLTTTAWIIHSTAATAAAAGTGAPTDERALERGRRATTPAPLASQLARARLATARHATSLWHPDLVTLHLWVWYPNPAGLYNGTNPYIRPFNRT